MNTDSISAIERDVRALMDAEAVPGAAVAVVRDGHTVYRQGFGVRDVASGAPVTPDTVFGIGSCGKSVTSAALMQLVERGLVALDTPVVEVLPEFRLPDDTWTRAVTVEQLLCHGSGLPVLPALEIALGWRESDIPMADAADLLRYLATIDRKPVGRPGERFSYSNDGYGVAGEVISRLSGMSYIDYMHRHVFEALGMSRSTLHDPPALGWDDVTSLYDYDEASEAPKTVHKPHWPNTAAIAAAGLHRSTANDMARYAIAHLDGFPGISDANRAELHHPRLQRDSTNSYALGWGVRPDYKGEHVLAHSGGITGVSAHVILAPARRTGVVVLLNVSGGPSAEIAERVLDHTLGLPLETPAPDYTPSEAELARATGSYTFGDQTVAVTREADTLLVSIGGKPARPLTPTAPNEFRGHMGRRPVAVVFEPGLAAEPAPLVSIMSRVCWRAGA